jgi:putative glycerol-1-phosphate prenyltransferase
VIAAPKIKRLDLETISTGYMLVDCGKATTASYISGTLPLPYDKPEIAAATAAAGEMIGMSCMYLDGGSGSEKPISQAMIHAVRIATKTPLIVGGGIRSEEEAADVWNAGADIIVMGTAFEENPELLIDIASLKTAD